MRPGLIYKFVFHVIEAEMANFDEFFHHLLEKKLSWETDNS